MIFKVWNTSKPDHIRYCDAEDPWKAVEIGRQYDKNICAAQPMDDTELDINKTEYIISGDSEKYTGCLICPCGSIENAMQVLQRMLTEPTENDKQLIGELKNLRIEAVKISNCWWNDPVLCN